MAQSPAGVFCPVHKSHVERKIAEEWDKRAAGDPISPLFGKILRAGINLPPLQCAGRAEPKEKIHRTAFTIQAVGIRLSAKGAQ
jgi:hypothetical protein